MVDEREFCGHTMGVYFLVVDGLKIGSIIGIDIMNKHRYVFNHKERVLYIGDVSIPLQNASCTIFQGHGDKRSVSLCKIATLQ